MKCQFCKKLVSELWFGVCSKCLREANEKRSKEKKANGNMFVEELKK